MNRNFVDDLGNTISLPTKPKRIVSLVPSLTQLLFDLQLNDEVVGITKFCVHPHQWFKSKTHIGGTKNINLAAVENLNPDLIIASKEENTKDQIEALRKTFSVFVTDVVDVKTALQTIKTIGQITNTTTLALQLAGNISNDLQEIKKFNNPTTIYMIWRNPYMTIGGDTYINSVLENYGFKNMVQQELRYPTLTNEQLIELQPELIMLSSEPYPFAEKHIAELSTILPNTKIILVDGEVFSWYGSSMHRIKKYANTLQTMLQ